MFNETIRLFVGYDPREAIAYHTFVDSVLRRSSIPIEVIPLHLGYLDVEQRDGSNNFIYSRFLVPYLTHFRGWAIYADGDMVCKEDIAKLWELRNYNYGIQVVKHEYKTKSKKKYLCNNNADYPRKNWSSLILWNCNYFPHRTLTPEKIKTMSGADLHRFTWMQDNKIGDLPIEWNWLVGEYPHNDHAKLLHYTLGIPAFSEYTHCDHSSDWWLAMRDAIHFEGKE